MSKPFSAKSSASSTQKCESSFSQDKNIAPNDATVVYKDDTADNDPTERLLMSDRSSAPSRVPLATASRTLWTLSTLPDTGQARASSIFASSSVTPPPAYTKAGPFMLSAMAAASAQDFYSNYITTTGKNEQDTVKRCRTDGVSYMPLDTRTSFASCPNSSRQTITNSKRTISNQRSALVFNKQNIFIPIILVGIMFFTGLFTFMAIQAVFSTNYQDEKNLLLQQRHETVGKLDLSKYAHLQRKVSFTTPKPAVDSHKTVPKGEIESEQFRGNNLPPNAYKPSLRIAYSAASSSLLSPKLSSKVETNEPAFKSDLREVEFESDSEVVPSEMETSVGGPVETTDKCSECVPKRFFAHYARRGCKPVVSRTCSCTRFFRCPQTFIPEARAGQCEFDGRIYQLNEQISMGDNCQVCRCLAPNSRPRTRHHNSTTIGVVDCSISVECPEIAHGVRPKPGCWYVYKPDECCGREVCSSSQPEVRCKYNNRSYRVGERIFPKEDPCVECICDSNWNEFDPEHSSSCKPVKCREFARSHLLHRCTPIYRKTGCCPIDFLCGKHNSTSGDDGHVQKEQPPHDLRGSPVDETKICTLNGRHFKIGQEMRYPQSAAYRKRTCSICKCQVPPLLTCLAESDCN